jgi:DNA-binding NtrC family response regulator
MSTVSSNGIEPAGGSRPAWGVDACRIVGSSPAIMAALKLAERLAPTEMPILLVGETGTGKELLARRIHDRSGRTGEMVCVDCGALPHEIAESLLFGYDQGAFTGAVRRTEGLVRAADGGTLFLDELSSLPLSGQAKLLRVLETGRIRRLGSTKARRSDFRIIATAQSDFAELVQAGRLRADLLQRIAGAIIQLPRLDDRRADTPALARHFAGHVGATLSEAAQRLLQEHSWPGNVRELRWTVQRAALLSDADTIDVAAVEAALELGLRTFLTESGPQDPSRGKVAELKAACEAYEGDPKRIANAMGIGRTTLYRRLKDARLDLSDFRRNDKRP